MISNDAQLNVLTALPTKDLKEIFLAKLKEGAIFTVSVLDKLKDNTLLLNIGTQTFLGSSKQDLTKGTKFLAKVLKTSPRLTMELIENVPQDSPILVKEKLQTDTAKMGLLINERNTAVINALKEASVPLNNDNLQQFMKNISENIIDDPARLKTAAELFSRSIKPTDSLVENISQMTNKEINTASNFEQQIALISEKFKALSPEIQNSLKEILSDLPKITETITLKESVNPEEMSLLFDKTKELHPFYREANLIKELTEIFANNKNLPESLENFKEELVKQLPVLKEFTPPLPQSAKILNELTNLIDSFQKTAETINEEQLLSKSSGEELASREKELLHKIFNNSEQLINIIKRSELHIFDKDATDTLKIIRDKAEAFINESLNIPKPPPLAEQKNTDLNYNDYRSAEQFLSRNKFINNLNINNNIKERLYLTEEKIETLQKQSPETQNNTTLNELKENVKNLINDLTTEQLKDVLRQLSPQTPDYLSIPLLLPEGKGSLNVIIEQMKGRSKKDDQGKFFSVYFSMELSNLGYFEINLLDNNKNIDLTFFSASEEIKNLFLDNSQPLKERLLKLPIASVNLRAASGMEKELKNTISEPQFNINKNTTKGIDIIT